MKNELEQAKEKIQKHSINETILEVINEVSNNDEHKKKLYSTVCVILCVALAKGKITLKEIKK